MDRAEFKFEIVEREKMFSIYNVEHDEFEVILIPVTSRMKTEILELLKDFLSGKLDVHHICKLLWSDGDPEEPSTDRYIAINKKTGDLSDIISNMENLVKFIHNDAYHLYRLIIEDNLI